MQQRPEALPAAEVINMLRNRVARNPGDLDTALMLGSALYQAGRLPESIAAFKSLLNQNPNHPQALLLLARSEAQTGNPGAALKALARAQQVDAGNNQVWQVAVALAADARDWTELLRIGTDWTRVHPDSIEGWQALSRAHFEESRFQEAIAAYDRVLALQPGNPTFLIGAARLAIAAQRYQQARDYLEEAGKFAPDSADLFYTLGRLHHLTGELETAEQYYRRAIAARPGFATAYVELGTLREGRLDDEEIRAILQLFTDPSVHPEYRVMLGFTLGDALDRRSDFDQAFRAWDQANAIDQKLSGQEGIVHRPEQVEDEPRLLAGMFNTSMDLEPESDSGTEPRPIFVVGMPRSGTTLVESILASHSEVYGAGELPTLYDIHEKLMSRARNSGIDAALDLLRREAGNWRKRYLDALPASGGASSVVDKQPLNFRSIGLIRLLFPESPIIYTRRAPMDVGLSIYRHKFSKNWPCAHSLSDIGHFYGVHQRIMELWQSRYGPAIHVVDHKALVNDPQTEISRLLAFCSLDPQAACFEPHKTKRPIATFSSVQVRQPLSAAFSGRAGRYAMQLEPLRQALVKAGVVLQSDSG
ncbi:MAG: sulfotransferase [Pseudomonadales bacterium]|nr:sulfotransferase [Pseudomonadales bacterium]